MKKIALASVLLSAFLLVGCGEKPVTEADTAKKLGLTTEEYQAQKEAAARMNMTVEDHVKMGH
jgi:hypothetical protein